MDADYSFVSPVDARDVLNREGFRSFFRAMYEPRMRDEIMMMAGYVKGFDPLPFEAAAAVAEINDYSAEDAVRAFNQISGGDSGVLEFHSIVGKLPIDDLHILREFLKVPYYMMLLSYDSENISYFDHLRATFEPGIRKNILKMAGKMKGVVFPSLLETATTQEAAATAAGTNYSTVEDAMRAFVMISGGDTNGGALRFQSIVGKLPIDDLQTLKKLLEEPYYMMLRSENSYPTRRPEVKEAASGGGGDSFVTKFAGQAIGAMLAKVAGGAVFGAFEAPTFLEPLEKAAGAVGLMSVIGGMVLQDKKPGLSRAMVKFGSVAIAFALILPMAGSLETVIMAWIFGFLAAAIVAVTVTFA